MRHDRDRVEVKVRRRPGPCGVETKGRDPTLECEPGSAEFGSMCVCDCVCLILRWM